MTEVLFPPIAPMLARAAADIPDPAKFAGGLAFEPKWDGFRMILFNRPDGVVLQSRGGEDLAYCFPEIVSAAAALPIGLVVDGELVVAHDGRLWFDELSTRIRPRREGGRKIAELAQDSPATFVAFDLLALPGRSLIDEPLVIRRRELVGLAQLQRGSFRLTPITEDREVARRWLAEFEGAGLDGVVAKPLDAPYAPGARSMIKIKHARTADVVVAGWREFKQRGDAGQAVVGSLLLGLHDADGRLHHIGVASAFPLARRGELVAVLAPFGLKAGEAHPWLDPAPEVRAPGGQSRWTGGKDLSFHPLRPVLVAEVGYDQLSGDRLRHVAQFLRWRPDRTAESCGYDQIERPTRYDILDVLRPADAD